MPSSRRTSIERTKRDEDWHKKCRDGSTCLGMVFAYHRGVMARKHARFRLSHYPIYCTMAFCDFQVA